MMIAGFFTGGRGLVQLLVPVLEVGGVASFSCWCQC